jgi:hypothetical protein
VALDNANEVEEFATPKRIMNKMTTRADPIGSDGSDETRRQTIDRDDASPGHATREGCGLGAEKYLADARMDTIGSDRALGPRRCSVREAQHNARGRLLDVDAPRTQRDGIAFEPPHGTREQFMKVRTMERNVGGAIAFN